MKKYLVRKCLNCGLWHVFKINEIKEFIIIDILATFRNWEDCLLTINYPEFVKIYSIKVD